MRISLLFRKLTALGVLLLAGPSLLLAQVSLQDLGVKIVSKNTYYTITSIKESPEPGFLKFSITSAHAVYQVEGVLPLMKVLHEIEVIEKIRRNEQTSGFFDGAASSVEDTADGFVKLVSHPIESGKGLGKAAGKIGSSIGGLFRDKEQGEKTSFKDSLIGQSERELAKNYQVDVYTTNTYLKNLLNSMAKARAGGKGAIFAVSFLIPVGLIGAAITVSSVNGAADQLINDSSKGELFQLNKQALLELGCPSADVERFVNSPYYTPREVTYIRTYLEKLKHAVGFRDVLKVAADLKNPLDIKKVLYTLQIAAEEAQKDPYSFDHIEIKGDGLWASTQKKLVWILPYDYLQNNRHGELLLNQATDEWKSDPKRQFEIWNAGQVKQDFLRAASRRGVKLQWFRLWGGIKNNAQV